CEGQHYSIHIKAPLQAGLDLLADRATGLLGMAPKVLVHKTANAKGAVFTSPLVPELWRPAPLLFCAFHKPIPAIFRTIFLVHTIDKGQRSEHVSKTNARDSSCLEPKG